MISEQAQVLKYSNHLIQGVAKVFRGPAVMALVRVLSYFINRFFMAFSARKPKSTVKTNR